MQKNGLNKNTGVTKNGPTKNVTLKNAIKNLKKNTKRQTTFTVCFRPLSKPSILVRKQDVFLINFKCFSCFICYRLTNESRISTKFNFANY